MFFNVSNHPSAKWSKEQLDAAVGPVTDIQFPNVPPTASTEDVWSMACSLWHQMMQKAIDAKLGISAVCTAMVQGESSLTFLLSHMLLSYGWRVVVATTERAVVENPDGTKTVAFKFVQFRELFH